MKKNALVQLVIICVGIITIYSSIINLLPDITLLVINLFGKENYGQSYIAGAAFIYLLGLAAGVIVITKSGRMSEFITEKSGLDDSLKIYTNPQQLLSIFIVVLAISRLLDHVPVFLHDSFLFFTNQIPHRPGSPLFDFNDENAASPKWLIIILQVLLPCLMIIYCRQLTEYFSKNILLDNKGITLEHETIIIETTDTPQ